MRYQGTKINPTKNDVSQIKFYIILLPMAIFMLLPLIYIFSTAFKPFSELFAYPPTFLVRRPTFENFQNIFSFLSRSTVPVSRYLFNSISSTILIAILSVLLSLNAGYILSKKSFKFKNALFAINTVSLMFIPSAVKIPRYMVIEKMGLLNTFSILILPLVAMPVGLFLVKQFIDQIPDALIEAAQIDGANDFQIIIKIVAPIVTPALVTVAILAFQASWNSPDASKFYLNDDSLKTFAFFIDLLGVNAGSEVGMQGMVSAAALILFIPNLIIFIFMQNKVLNTMAHSGIK